MIKGERFGRAAFIAAYIDAMLWSTSDESTDNGGKPLDRNYTEASLTVTARAKIHADCDRFMRETEEIRKAAWETKPTCDDAQAGHDFWMTRNGHGVGFWDGDWPSVAGELLTRKSKAYGEVNVYVHRKRLHIM